LTIDYAPGARRSDNDAMRMRRLLDADGARMSLHAGPGARGLGLAILSTVLLFNPVAATDDLNGDPLSVYLSNPYGNRRAVIALARHGTDSLPTPALLALADAYARDGRPRRARRVLTDLLARTPPPNLAAWAEHGLGWIALASGDSAGARLHYGRLAAGGVEAALGTLVVALLDGIDGRVDQAATVLDRIAVAADTPWQLRPAALLGAAYAHYWAKDYGPAAVRFASVAEQFPGSPLSDDARYAAAWTRLQAGDREAIAALQRVAAEPSSGRAKARVGPGLVRLAPATLLRSGARQYRRAPLLQPVEQLVALLDVDGPALARAALRQIGIDQPPTVPVAEVDADNTPPRVAAPETPLPDPSPPRDRPLRPAPPSADASRHPWVLAIVIVSLLLLVAHRARKRLGKSR